MRSNPIPAASAVRFRPQPRSPLHPVAMLRGHWSKDAPSRILYSLAALQLSIDPFIERYRPKSRHSLLTAREEPHQAFLREAPSAVLLVAMSEQEPESLLPYLDYAERKTFFLIGPRIKGTTALLYAAAELMLRPYGRVRRGRARRYAMSVLNNAVLRLSRVFGPTDGRQIAAMLWLEWLEQPPEREQGPDWLGGEASAAVHDWHSEWRSFWDLRYGPRQLRLPGVR